MKNPSPSFEEPNNANNKKVLKDLRHQVRSKIVGLFVEEYAQINKVLGERPLVRFGPTLYLKKEEAKTYDKLLLNVDEVNWVEIPSTHVVIEVNDHLAEELKRVKDTSPSTFYKVKQLFAKVNPSLDLDLLLSNADISKKSKVNQTLREYLTLYLSNKFEAAGIPHLIIFSGGSSYHIHVFTRFDLNSYMISLIKNNPTNQRVFTPSSRSLRRILRRWNITSIVFYIVMHAAGLIEDFLLHEVPLKENPFFDTSLLERSRMVPIPIFKRMDKDKEVTLFYDPSIPEEDMYKLWDVPYTQDIEKFLNLFKQEREASATINTSEVTFLGDFPEEKRYINVFEEVAREVDMFLNTSSITNNMLLGLRVGFPAGMRDNGSGRLYIHLRQKGYPRYIAYLITERVLLNSEPAGEMGAEKKKMLDKLLDHTENNFRNMFEDVFTPLEEDGFTLGEILRIDYVFEAWRNFLRYISKIRIYFGVGDVEVERVLTLKNPLYTPKEADAAEDVPPTGLYGRRVEEIPEYEVSANISKLDTLFESLLSLFSEWANTGKILLEDGKPFVGISVNELLSPHGWIGSKDKVKKRKANFFKRVLKKYFEKDYFERIISLPVERVSLTDNIIQTIENTISVQVVGDPKEKDLTSIPFEEMCERVTSLIQSFSSKDMLMQVLYSLTPGGKHIPHSKIEAIFHTLVSLKRFKGEDGQWRARYSFRKDIFNRLKENICSKLRFLAEGTSAPADNEEERPEKGFRKEGSYEHIYKP